MEPTFKTITTSDNWIIEKALQGSNNRVRIDARTRYHIPDGINRYSEWLSIDYVNRIRRQNGLCRIQESNAWHY